MNKNKKVIVLIIISFVIVLLYFFLIGKIMFGKNNNIPQDIEKDTNKTNNILNDVEEKQYKDIEEKTESKIKTETETDGNNVEKKDATETNIKIIESLAKENIERFEFDKAEDYMSKELQKYNLENSKEYKEKQVTFNEIALMTNFPAMRRSEKMKELRELIKGLKDSDNFLISVMWLDNTDREYILKTSDSINPIFDGGIKIIEKKKINEKDSIHLKNIRNSINNIQEITEYKIEIEGNVLLAYIVRDNERLHFYKLVEEIEGITPYYTINEWNRNMENLEKSTNYSNPKEEIIEEEKGDINE